MSRLLVLAQLPFRIVPSVAVIAGDRSHSWLCHVRLPSESALPASSPEFAICTPSSPPYGDLRLVSSWRGNEGSRGTRGSRGSSEGRGATAEQGAGKVLGLHSLR